MFVGPTERHTKDSQMSSGICSVSCAAAGVVSGSHSATAATAIAVVTGAGVSEGRRRRRFICFSGKQESGIRFNVDTR